jgi:integrase
VRLLILTAAREGEVADLAAGEVDRAAGLWTIPAGRAKNGRAVTVPLCALALAELAAVWPEGGEARPGFRPLRVRGFSKIKASLDQRIAAARAQAGEVAAPMPPWRLHDLRRTARTGMTRLGVPRDHAEAALNHVSGRSALERTYDRHDYAPEVIAALGRWQAHVAKLVAATTPAAAATGTDEQPR